MSYWNTANADKPWGPFDTDAELDYPVDITDWLDGLGSSYAAHTVVAAAPLEGISSTHSGGVITVRVRAANVTTDMMGQKYPFTIRLTTANGQRDDRSLWLKLRDR